MASLAGVLIMLMWLGIRSLPLNDQYVLAFLFVAAILTIGASLIAFIGLSDRGYRRDFVFRALVLVVIDFAALALLNP